MVDSSTKQSARLKLSSAYKYVHPVHTVRTYVCTLVMHRYHFLATDTDTDTFRQKMADTDSIPILWYTNITHQ